MSTTKAIALVVDNKIDYMLQQRQIVKTVGNQIDIEYPAYRKYAITDFHHLDWLLISVIVTINRTVPLPRRYETNSHSIIMITTKLRSNI